MQIIKHKTNIDFISRRRPALFISSVLNLGIIVGIAKGKGARRTRRQGTRPQGPHRAYAGQPQDDA